MNAAKRVSSRAVDERKAAGRFYTPQPIVRYMVRRCCEEAIAGGLSLSRIRILDPACGDGAFLREAFDQLAEAGGNATARGEVLSRLYGVDLDAQAVDRARQVLAETAGWAAGPIGEKNCESNRHSTLTHNLRLGDALIGPSESHENAIAAPLTPVAFDWRQAFPEVFEQSQGFDVVVANPPYVNIRILSQTLAPWVKDHLHARYRCARRGYDLYVLFLERAYELLRTGGICGMILPNKIAALDYAAACRRLLLEDTTLLEIVDVSDLDIFAAASVYPYIVTWRKCPPATGHAVRVLRAVSLDDLSRPLQPAWVAQHDWSPAEGFQLHGSLDVESRVATQPLGERATLHSGTTGFVAERLAQELVERDSVSSDPLDEHFEFIVSGNIDRYSVQHGKVRYMKRQFRRPLLPAGSLLVSDQKRRLFRNPKIVCAGMSRRLEAAWDPGGLALGVQVYAVAQPLDDPYYLLGLLNSRLMSYLFQMRYRAKRLASGYLAINKGQLAKLPVRLCDTKKTRELARRIAKLARAMLQLSSADRRGQQIDDELDGWVFALYELSAAEIALIQGTVKPDL